MLFSTLFSAPQYDEQRTAVKVSDRRLLRLGVFVIVLCFGVFGGWSVLAPLDSAAVANGVVVVASQRKSVQHLEGGIVKDIRVQEGERVEQGQPLVVLDNTQTGAELDILNSQYYSARVTEARLLAEMHDNPNVVYPDNTSFDAKRGLSFVAVEESLFQARKGSLQGEINVLEQRIEQFEAQIRSKEELVRSYQGEITDLKALLAEGFIDKQRLRELERNSATVKGEMAEARVQIVETRLQIVQIRKNFQNRVIDQLSDIQRVLSDLDERIAAISDRHERTVITAPVSGTVLDLKVHTVGGVIAPGSTVLDIVPGADNLIVEAKVSPVDIDKVFPGQETRVRFSAFNSATTPEIPGVVQSVSADRLVHENTGEPYYLAQVAVTDAGFEKLGKLTLVPGMPADVLIKTGERTLMQYLLQPATNAFARALNEE